MNKILLLLLTFLIIPGLTIAATVTLPSEVRLERNNILPNTNLITAFSNDTTGTSEAFGLGEAKIRCHTWTIDTDKTTGDVSWAIQFLGSLDNNQWAVYDSTTTVADWSREVTNHGANWIKTSVLRNYTTTAPNIDIKFQSGCN